jgi:hypothetical protein
VTYADIEGMINDSAKEGILHYQLLVDARKVTFNLFPSDIARFADLVQTMAEKSVLGMTAVLVSDSVANGIIHLLSLIASGMAKVKGFRDRESAERWLGWEAGAGASNHGVWVKV